MILVFDADVGCKGEQSIGDDFGICCATLDDDDVVDLLAEFSAEDMGLVILNPPNVCVIFCTDGDVGGCIL